MRQNNTKDVTSMFHNKKLRQVSIIEQTEDRTHRYDYSNTQINLHSGIVGTEQNIKDSR